MELPPYHHRRCVPFSDGSSFYHPQLHRLPPPPPLPTAITPVAAPPPPLPPPHHLSLPPPPPIPPPAQSQFSFRPNPTIEERPLQLSNFIPPHLLNQTRPPPRLHSSPRTSSYHHNNRSQPRYDDNSRISDPLPDMPLFPSVPPEPLLDHHNHHLPISPLSPHSGNCENDYSSLRFRDDFKGEGFRADVSPQLPLWGRKETLFDDHKYRYGAGRDGYEWNCERGNRDFVSADRSTTFSLNPSRDSGLDDGDYDFFNHSEGQVRWRNSTLDTQRKYVHNSMHFRGQRPESFENSGFEDLSRPKINRVGDKRADLFFSRSPRKKQLQKRSGLQRIRLGKANNNRNRSHDYRNFPKSYLDKPNSVCAGSFEGKETDCHIPLERKIEEREKSPVELDVSFKSNALIAKAIKADPSPIAKSSRTLMSRNRKIRKINLCDSPGIGFRENLDRTDCSPNHLNKDHKEFANNVFADRADGCIHDSHHSDFSDKSQKSEEKVSAIRTDSCIICSDSPSDSDTDLRQLTKKIRVSLSGKLSPGCSEPCSSGLGGNTAYNESPKSAGSDQEVNGVACDGTFEGIPRKRKGVASPLEPKSDAHEQTSWNCSSTDGLLQAIPLNEGLSSSSRMDIVSPVASDFHTNLLDGKVKSSSSEDPNLKKRDIDINSSQLLLPQSSAAASALQSSRHAYIFCEAAENAETPINGVHYGLNLDKGVQHPFQEELVLAQNGPGSKAKNSVEVNAAIENKVPDAQMDSYTFGNEGCNTSSSEQRLSRITKKVDVAHAADANSEEFSANQVAVLEANGIIEHSSDPVSSLGNSDILCVSPFKFEAVPKESSVSIKSTVDLQLGSVDIASQGAMDDLEPLNGKESGDDNCQTNLPCMENLTSFSNNLSLNVDVSCVLSTNSADGLVDYDSEALFNNVTSSPDDVPSNLLLDKQKSSKSELSNGYHEKQKIFTESPVSGVETVSASSLSSKNGAALGQSLTSTVSIVNTPKMFPISQNNPNVIQNSDPLPDKSSLNDNWVANSMHGVFPGRTSVKYPSVGKGLPFNLVSRPRTWHRTGTSLQSVAGSKGHGTSRINLQKEFGKVQNAYVRKGNSLVRKPNPVGAVSQRLQASTPSIYRLSPGTDNLKKARGCENDINITEPPTSATMGGCTVGPERPKTPPLTGTIKSLNCGPAGQGDSTSSQADPYIKSCSDENLDASNSVEPMDVRKYSEESLTSGIKEHEDVSRSNLSGQSTIDERKSGKKITYVKRKSNQLVAFSNSSDPSFKGSDKPHPLSSDGYYKRRKNQLIRSSIEDNTEQLSIIPGKILSSRREEVLENAQNRSSSKRQLGKGFMKKKFSLVWTLHDTLSSTREGNSGHSRNVRPFLLPWRRPTTYWTSFKHSSSSMPNDNLVSPTSRKLLFSRKSDAIYKRSPNGFSLQRSKVLGLSGRSLKWSKSIERKSRKANEDARLAVVAAEKRKREQNGATFTNFKSLNYVSRKSVYCKKLRPGERIFRIGSERYRMDPTGKTLQRISVSDCGPHVKMMETRKRKGTCRDEGIELDVIRKAYIADEKPSYSEDQSENRAKKFFVPRRLLIGNDEYVRIGNGNQLVRDPKKRTRVLANEKVRWSLHTARLRLARKKKFCQFFTRFGKCNKDDKKCPYIHDPSKIAVCTKFLNGCCSDSNCKLTHEVIPERMQDCSYFLQGLCSNESCPYRHVNVNPNSPVCEGFLRGYCADGNECRKKHTYVCPVFEATGNCHEGAKCKLHHPKAKKKGIRSKASIVQKNARGRYFGSQHIDIANSAATVPKLITGECDERIFCQDGKFTDFISLADSDEAMEEVEPRVELSCDSDRERSEIVDQDELIRPLRIMKKNLVLDASPAVGSIGEMISSYVSESSLQMR